VGNPDLLPVSALNLDAFAEHYMSNLGVISGGVYYKQLSDFIYTRRFQAPYPLNSPDPLADDINFIQAQNGEQANLFGMEFGFQRQLDFLPGVLKNLGLYVNYTFTSSDAEFQRTDDSRLESVRLPGQAAHVGNFSLAYNDDKISLRAAMNLNGEYLTEIGATANDDIYVNGRLQFDVTAGYRISKNWRVFAEMINLTNQPFELYSGSSDSIIQREFYSWWSRIGVKFDLN
jgi:TonB-dependent receptor